MSFGLELELDEFCVIRRFKELDRLIGVYITYVAGPDLIGCIL